MGADGADVFTMKSCSFLRCQAIKGTGYWSFILKGKGIGS